MKHTGPILLLLSITLAIACTEPVQYKTLLPTTDVSIPAILADSSVVYQNIQTQISVPEKITERSRTIQVTGEAFVKVSNLLKSDFTIEAANVGQIHCSNGTEINLKNYPNDSSYKISVLKGSAILQNNGYEMQIMAPETYIKTGLNGQKRKDTIDIEGEIKWIQKCPSFSDMYLKVVLNDIERQYNCKLIADKYTQQQTLQFEYCRNTYELKDIFSILARYGITIDTTGNNTYTLTHQ